MIEQRRVSFWIGKIENEYYLSLNYNGSARPIEAESIGRIVGNSSLAEVLASILGNMDGTINGIDFEDDENLPLDDRRSILSFVSSFGLFANARYEYGRRSISGENLKIGGEKK